MTFIFDEKGPETVTYGLLKMKSQEHLVRKL